MKNLKSTVLSLGVVCLVLAQMLSCSSSDEESYGSPTSLFVDYISAYTTGVISNRSQIKIRFAKEIAEIIPGQEFDISNFSFDPGIDGTAFWEDKQTLVFKPSGLLPSGTRYKAEFLLTELFDTPEDRERFKFIFETIPQNFDVEIQNYAPYDPEKLELVKLTGKLVSADHVPNDFIEKLLKAEQDGSNLSITWIHTENNTHRFTIENVKRKEDAEEVNLTWNGEPIDLDKEGELTYDIPSLKDFKVLSVKLIQDEENYISVLFSDPLSKSQNLRGLIQLAGLSSNPKFVLDLNEVKIYPSEDLAGEVELTVFEGIKNSGNYPLTETFRTSLLFQQTQPDLRITANKGTIIPGGQGLILPFEAVNLRAVDVEVIRIFEDNMLQYLQVNRMGGQSELSRVGRPVVRKTISLEAMGVPNLGKWNRYTLDLAEIFEAQAGALYQVRIKFRKQHSLYFCGTQDGGELTAIAEEQEEDWGPSEDSWWDYNNYYYYSWEERQDPCSEAYFATRRPQSKILFASDIGIIAKHSDGGKAQIFTTRVTSTDPLSGVQIKIYDYQQQVIAEGTTDGEGALEIEVSGTPFAVVAMKDNQVGYLKMDDGSSLSVSNFDVGGNKVKNGLKGFVYGERGVWRPGDTLHLSFIKDDPENKLPENYPVVLELFDPQGKLYQRKVSSSPKGNIYYFPVSTSTEAPTGNWRAIVKAGGATFSKSLKVETVKPNRLKIELDFGTDKLTYLDKQMSGDLKVRWLHGATAGGLKADYEVLLVPTKTSFKGYTNVSFDDPSKDFYVENEQIFQGRLNNEGFAKVNFSLNTDDEPPGALNAIFKGKVYEEGGDFSIDKVVIPYYPYSSFVGLSTPEGDKRGMLLTDKDHTVRIVSVDAYGKPVTRDNIKVELFKMNWRWWWDNSYDNISNYVGRESRSPIMQGTASTVNGEGKYQINVKSPEWGRFYLRVTDPVSGHSAGKIVYFDWPGWAGKSKRGDMGGATMLMFEVDKEEYEVGEKATLTIPSSSGGRALISLESGSKVLETFWVETEEEKTVVDFETTMDMAPTVYAHITLLQPHAQTSNDLPIRLYGIQALNVVNKNSKLEPVVTMPKELRPEQEFEVTVAEKSGKPMAYTVAIVDDGLLDLTKFKTPDPWNTFYAREALGVKTWDIYDDVMGAYAGSIERLLAVGGDGELNAQDPEKANRFKPVVVFKGPFLLDGGDKASHKFKMPQYVGSVRTMVVAANDMAYGSSDVTTPVKQPLMILATLPRVAGPDEKIKLPVNIFSEDKNIKEISLKVETEGNLKVAGPASKKVVLKGGANDFIEFDLISSRALGIGKVKVTATGGDNKAVYDVELDVRPSNPMMTDVEGELLTKGQSYSKSYNPLGLSTTNDALLEISTMPPLNLEQRMEYLIRYPHGCIEQTTSSVFPQLYLSELTDLDKEKEAKLEDNIKAGISRLRLFQRGSGGFSYWPGNEDENAWGTNYAGHFLLAAKNQGYNVPSDMISSWISFQKERSNSWPASANPNRHDQLIQAYRLYTLAYAGEPDLGAMNRMKNRQELDNMARWQLALSYAIAGYKSDAKDMVQSLTTEVMQYNLPGRTYGSSERDKAIILRTLVQLDNDEASFELVRDISETMGNPQKWMSTQTTAYCLMAVSDYANANKVDGSTAVDITVDGKSRKLNTDKFITQFYIPEPDKVHDVVVTNTSDVPVYTRLIRRGIPLEGMEVDKESNLKMTVRYVDMEGNPVDVSRLKQGTNFRAEVTVQNPGLLGDYQELALSQVFPSGWEIVNTRLDDTQGYYQQDEPEYQDIRDDRVYTYFDLKENERKVFTVLLNASYVGEYYMPGVSAEAMYDNRVQASRKGARVQIVK